MRLHSTQRPGEHAQVIRFRGLFPSIPFPPFNHCLNLYLATKKWIYFISLYRHNSQVFPNFVRFAHIQSMLFELSPIFIKGIISEVRTSRNLAHFTHSLTALFSERAREMKRVLPELRALYQQKGVIRHARDATTRSGPERRKFKFVSATFKGLSRFGLNSNSRPLRSKKFVAQALLRKKSSWRPLQSLFSYKHSVLLSWKRSCV